MRAERVAQVAGCVQRTMEACFPALRVPLKVRIRVIEEEKCFSSSPFRSWRWFNTRAMSAGEPNVREDLGANDGHGHTV